MREDGNTGKTHCKHGHELAGGNLYIHPKRGYRECKACRRRRTKHFSKPINHRPISDDLKSRVLTALRGGKTLKNVLGGLKGKQYDGAMRITSWVRFAATEAIDPAFGKLARSLSMTNGYAVLCNAVSNRCGGRRNYVVAAPTVLPAQFWTDGHHIYEAVREATKDVRSPEIRQEVMSAMFIAIQEQKFPASEAKSHVKQFVRGYWRENDRSLFSKFGSVSLDEPIFDDSATDRYDRISEDQRLWV